MISKNDCFVCKNTGKVSCRLCNNEASDDCVECSGLGRMNCSCDFLKNKPTNELYNVCYGSKRPSPNDFLSDSEKLIFYEIISLVPFEVPLDDHYSVSIDVMATTVSSYLNSDDSTLYQLIIDNADQFYIPRKDLKQWLASKQVKALRSKA